MRKTRIRCLQAKVLGFVRVELIKCGRRESGIELEVGRASCMLDEGKSRQRVVLRIYNRARASLHFAIKARPARHGYARRASIHPTSGSHKVEL